MNESKESKLPDFPNLPPWPRGPTMLSIKGYEQATKQGPRLTLRPKGTPYGGQAHFPENPEGETGNSATKDET